MGGAIGVFVEEKGLKYRFFTTEKRPKSFDRVNRFDRVISNTKNMIPKFWARRWIDEYEHINHSKKCRQKKNIISKPNPTMIDCEP